jgi:hypothetical protein
LKSGDGVGKLVKRFNAGGLSALSIAAGAGRKPTYTSDQRARIVREVQREPVLPLSVVDNSAFSPNLLTTPFDLAYSSF